MTNMTSSTIPDTFARRIISSAKSAARYLASTTFPNYFREEEIEDIANTVICKACVSIGGYRPEYPLSRWIRSIATNCIKDAASWKHNHEPIWGRMTTGYDPDGEECEYTELVPSSDDWVADSEIEYVEFRDRLDDEVRNRFGDSGFGLYADCRDGYTPREIAARDGRSANSVSIRKHNILSALKETAGALAAEYGIVNGNLEKKDS